MSHTVVELKAASRITANDTSAAVDLSDFTGEALLVLNSSITEGADNTSDVKIQHCDTVGGTYVDSGVAFTQVTHTANGFQALRINVDQFKQFVKVVSTLAGTTPAVTNGVELYGKKMQG